MLIKIDRIIRFCSTFLDTSDSSAGRKSILAGLLNLTTVATDWFLFCSPGGIFLGVGKFVRFIGWKFVWFPIWFDASFSVKWSGEGCSMKKIYSNCVWFRFIVFKFRIKFNLISQLFKNARFFIKFHSNLIGFSSEIWLQILKMIIDRTKL